MQIKITYSKDNNSCECQYMVIKYGDNKSEYVEVYPLYECPEDAIIGRSLISCDEILKYMELAYEVGKAGEELIIEKGEE